MKFTGTILFFFIFKCLEILNNTENTNISNNISDTLDVRFAINCDTNSYLISLYKSPYHCQPELVIPNCQLYKNKFIDTCFDLGESDMKYLKTKTPESEFLLFSNYFKKHIINYQLKNKKVRFKGFKFCVYKCKLIVNRNNYKTKVETVPENTKYLLKLKKIIYLDSVKLIRN